MNEKTETKTTVSRRQFGAAAGAAAVAAGTPGVAMARGSTNIAEVTESMVTIPSAAGAVQAFFTRPAKGAHPAVLTWRDQSGLGVDSRSEARRLAKQGFSVLILDRDGGDAPKIEADAKDAVAWLENHNSVDEKTGVGTPEWAKQRIEAKRGF